MEINGVEVYKADEIDTIYRGRLSSKRKFIELLEADGYLFLANNFRTMNSCAKWSDNDPVRVASSCKRKPLFLWAVKPNPCEFEDQDIYELAAWR